MQLVALHDLDAGRLHSAQAALRAALATRCLVRLRFAAAVHSLLGVVRHELGTPYLEAEVSRVVGLGGFLAAAVPHDADQCVTALPRSVGLLDVATCDGPGERILVVRGLAEAVGVTNEVAGSPGMSP